MAARSSPPLEDTAWRADSIFLLVATVVLLVARLPIIPVRYLDPDELEHSHAAWSLFRGLLPYRDFFEHHTPWYYFALAPFFRGFAVDQSFESARHFLIFARVLSLLLTGLSAVLAFRVGRLAADRRVGLLTAMFLLAQPVLIQKTLEIRPDVPALALFLGALGLLLRGLLEEERSTGRSLRWFLGGGLCLGGAVMCTQKMLFVLPGALVGLGLWALAGGRRGSALRIPAVLLFVVGVAVPGLLTWIGFALHGGGRQFIYNNFLLNARWRLRSDRHVLVVLETSAPILLLCVLGACVALRRFFRARQRRYADVLLLCILGGLILGIPVVPAAYKQYYLMPLPIVGLFAAKGLAFLVELAPERLRARFVVWASLPLLIWPFVDLGRSLARRDDQQIARLRYVFEHTRPSEPVLDGWLGSGVFRPHPLYYFFMHSELLAMLSERDKDAYLDALESGRARPSLIAVDVELMALGPRFGHFVQTRYATTDGLFYFPALARSTPNGAERPSH